MIKLSISSYLFRHYIRLGLNIEQGQNQIVLNFFLAKSEPFNIQFISDWFETIDESLTDSGNAASKTGSGFQLAYFMKNTGC